MVLIELLDEALSMRYSRLPEIESETFSVIGDIHADSRALKILTEDAFRPVVFLGDYADRGDEPVEVYRAILEGYISGDYILLRGNHESENVIPHDLPCRLGEEEWGEEFYRKLLKFWKTLPCCCIINGEIFAVHGGIYTKGCRIVGEGIKRSELMRDDAEIELMWNDPWENNECARNFERGIGYRFGAKATGRFLEDLGLKVVVRSHEPYKVLKVEHNGMVVTIGSTGVYGTRIARLNVCGKFRDGYDLCQNFGEIF
ncbi:metallophosphoesterase family protein [Geoglobus acetivorans]|uniref:Serine/threonine-protein phosphatase n=1 Tax=Geoglobus acetivorans TaxID=565033 RepID=A0A0A7GAW5_GEOAI|nr:Serine/threonine-protein phosphatase [Geoglobus acetivorans]